MRYNVSGKQRRVNMTTQVGQPNYSNRQKDSERREQKDFVVVKLDGKHEGLKFRVNDPKLRQKRGSLNPAPNSLVQIIAITWYNFFRCREGGYLWL
jgi:hypothetical protein